METQQDEPLALGPELRQLREEYRLDIQDVSETTKIRPVYIAALESGNMAELPDGAYIEGYLRSYAEFLGMDPDDAVERLYGESGTNMKRPKHHFPDHYRPDDRPSRALLLSSLALLLVVYGGWYIHHALERNYSEEVLARADEQVHASSDDILNSFDQDNLQSAISSSVLSLTTKANNELETMIDTDAVVFDESQQEQYLEDLAHDFTWEKMISSPNSEEATDQQSEISNAR